MSSITPPGNLAMFLQKVEHLAILVDNPWGGGGGFLVGARDSGFRSSHEWIVDLITLFRGSKTVHHHCAILRKH
jgi:hypothetical protein